MQRNQHRVPTEHHRVQVDQQLQEGLSLRMDMGMDLEIRARPADLIGQKRGAEVPELWRLDALQELLQPRQVLSGQAEPRV